MSEKSKQFLKVFNHVYSQWFDVPGYKPPVDNGPLTEEELELAADLSDYCEQLFYQMTKEQDEKNVEDGGMSKEQRARLIRETEEKIRQSHIYQFCVDRLAEENAIDSNRKTFRYDAEAVRQCQESAENGDGDAMIVLANIYKRGDGVMKDSDKALFWYQRAAEVGNSAAICHIARRYDLLGSLRNSSKDDIKAIKWYTRAAEAGRCDAMNRLGWIHLVGKGVDKDCEKAIEWFHKAAEAGHVNAMDVLASNYERGVGVTRNYDKAVEWYRKAAQRGHNGAEKRLRKLGELL